MIFNHHFFCYGYPPFIVFQLVDVELLGRDVTNKLVLDRELVLAYIALWFVARVQRISISFLPNEMRKT